MDGVNLNDSGLKLVKAGSQSSVEALSLSRIQGSNATDIASPLGADQTLNRTQVVGQGNLSAAISQLNDFVQTVQRDLQFEVDNEKGQTIVKVVDQSTQKVIRQIPDEIALRLAENLQQDEPLTLFDIKV